MMFFLFLICFINSIYYSYSVPDYGTEYNYAEDYGHYYDYSAEDVDVELLSEPKVFEVNEGDSVLLPCKVNASDVVRVWSRNDTLLSQGPIKLIHDEAVNILESGTFLKVTVISDKEVDNYTCSVSSSLDQTLKVTHTIVKITPKLISLPTVFEVTVGHRVQLPCEVIYSRSHKVRDFTRIWKKSNFYILYVGNIKIDPSENINILPEGNLEVNIESVKDKDVYTCEIALRKNLQAITHNIVVIPKLLTEPKMFKVNVGDTVTLPCEVSYDNSTSNIDADNVTRMWKENNDLLNYGDDVELLPNGSLKLTIKTIEDLKEYTCSISGGNDTQEVTHKVISETKAQLLTNSAVYSARLGATVSLPCGTSNDDNIMKIWIQGDKVLYDGTSKIIAGDNMRLHSGTLEVKMEKEDDFSEYTCVLKSSSNNRTVSYRFILTPLLPNSTRSSQQRTECWLLILCCAFFIAFYKR